MVSSTGQDHKKEFTFVCNVEKYQCHGTATKKQLAKQNAAMAMIKLIEEKIEAKEVEAGSSVALTIEELPSIDELLAEYRRMKKKHVTPPTSGNLRDRNNFFVKLPKENQTQAKQILKQDHSNPVQAKCIVHEAMTALNLKYEINRFGGNRAIFTLVESTFDCTITAIYDELFVTVIDYLKTMLNMNSVTGALSDVTNQKL